MDGRFESEAELEQAAAIVARYSKGRGDDTVTVEVKDPGGVAREVRIAPARPEDIPKTWLVA